MDSHETGTDQQPQLPDPDRGGSPTRFGIFTVLAELLVAALMIAVGVRFIIISGQSDLMAWVLLVLAALLLGDLGRRLIRIATGRDRR